MGFLAPYMLWGAAAASIPIILHFFFRSRYRTVPWAAMKFLLTSIEQTSRRLRFQELLLLLLRVAVLVLLALALARPLSRVVRGEQGGRGGDAVDTVFLFDTSYSMAANDGPKNRLQWAKETALGIIDQLPPYSTVQILTCADRFVERIDDRGPRSPGNLEQARQIIQTLKPTSLATDLAPGLVAAEAFVQRAQASNREFYLFSDMHQLGWEKQPSTVNKTLEKINEKANVYLVQCGRRPAKNAAVMDIVPQSGVPRPGERIGIAVIVRNTGTEPVENLELSLMVDGDEKTRETRPIPKLSAGETTAITLTAKLEKAGLRVLTAEVKSDDLAADNRLERIMLVREQVNVLIVDGKPSTKDAKDAASFHLAHALLPVQPNDRTKYYLQPRIVTPRFADPALLEKQDLVVLVNTSLKADPKYPGTPLPADFIAELEQFVRRGRALLVFAGDNVSPEQYNQILGKEHGLLPTPIQGMFDYPAEKPLFFDRKSAGLSAFSRFKEDKEYFKDFDVVMVWRGCDVKEPQLSTTVKKEPGAQEDGNPVQVVFRYNNGKPAVLSRKVDRGEVMFITTAASPLPIDGKPDHVWTIWSKLPSFAPFLDIAVNHLLHGQTQDHNLIAGETLHWYPHDNEVRSYKLINPDGKEERLGFPKKVGNREILTASNLPVAGIYQMESAPLRANTAKEAGKFSEPLAVAPDLRESINLESLTPETINQRLNFRPTHVTAGDNPTTFFNDDRFNREWTVWLLMGVLALVLGESLLAWWCGKSW